MAVLAAAPGWTPGQLPGIPFTPLRPPGKTVIPGPAAFALADTAINQLTSAATSVAVTLSRPVGQFDLLVGYAGAPSGFSVATDISDTAGNIWHSGGTSSFGTLIYCLSAIAAPAGLTVTSAGASGTRFLLVDRFTVASGVAVLFAAVKSQGSVKYASGAFAAQPQVNTPAGSLLYGALHTDTAGLSFGTGASQEQDAVLGSQTATSAGSALSEFILSALGGPELLTWSASAPVITNGSTGQAVFRTGPLPAPPGAYAPQVYAPGWGPGKTPGMPGGTPFAPWPPGLTGSAALTTPVTLTTTVTVSGTLTSSAGKLLPGTVTVTGVLGRQVSRPFPATAVTAGSLARQVSQAYPAVSATTGAVARQVRSTLPATVTATGSPGPRAVTRVLAGTVTATGNLIAGFFYQRVFQATVTTTGALGRGLGRVFSAVASTAGSLATFIHRRPVQAQPVVTIAPVVNAAVAIGAQVQAGMTVAPAVPVTVTIGSPGNPGAPFPPPAPAIFRAQI